jgi:hypothetical protein
MKLISYGAQFLFVCSLMAGWPGSLSLAQEPSEAVLVEGLDGGTYEAYKPAIITQVQEALKARGLYQGDVNGELDEETMESLAEFQKQHGLSPNGIPTPHTRGALLEEPKTAST